MTAPLRRAPAPASVRRGSVVLRARRYGVVWEVRAHDLVVLPILRPRRPDSADVPLDLAELAACRVPIADAVVRPAGIRTEERDAQLVGEVPASAICRVVRGMIRAAGDARARRHDDNARRSREHLADDRCVNLVA